MSNASSSQNQPTLRQIGLGSCIGCGCLGLLMLCGGPAPLLPFFFPSMFTKSGEELSTTPEFYSAKATNYSFHETFMHQVREFDIAEDAFLDMCKKRGWETLAIEKIPETAPFDRSQPRPWINYRREVPMKIPRYVYPREEHKGCDPWNADRCNVDPTGETDASCFRSVSNGYYFERRRDNGGGTEILYDSKNGRCYIHSNHH